MKRDARCKLRSGEWCVCGASDPGERFGAQLEKVVVGMVLACCWMV